MREKKSKPHPTCPLAKLDVPGSGVSVLEEGKDHTTKPNSDKRAQNKDRCCQESNSKEADMVNMEIFQCVMGKA